jgi:hypothetical protein
LGGEVAIEQINGSGFGEAFETVKQGFLSFFTEDIPNWWNTYIAPIFTGEFWQTQWQNIVTWWNSTVAPIFTAEFWSTKFYNAGVAFGNFIKSIIDSIVSIGKKLGEFVDKIKNALSSYENEVLGYYLQGYNYNDIAIKLDVTPKSIDNALTRIKNKLNFLKSKE